MSRAVNVSVRIDEDVKVQCEELYRELGLTLSSAINVFLRQSLRCGGIPFDVRIDRPNHATMDAIDEARRLSKDPNVRGYTVDDAFRELES